VSRKNHPESLCIDGKSQQAENGRRTDGHPDEGKSWKNTRLAGFLKPLGPTDYHGYQTTENGKNKHAVVAPPPKSSRIGNLSTGLKKIQMIRGMMVAVETS
jgi:hypothetical protein